MLNLDKFTKLQKKRKSNKKKCYKRILKQIITNVEINISQESNFIFFEMEPFIIGEAEYDMLECVNYLINKIKEDSNFKKILDSINFYEPNLLYIKWDMTKIN